MIKIYAILAAASAAFVFYIIGIGVGEWYLETLKSTEGIVTATEVVECKYVIPFVFSIVASYLAYKLVK